MRKFTAAIGIALLAIAGSAIAADAQYPSRPVRVIVPYPAGGSLDLIGRVYAKALGDSLGQPFIVDNRGGANWQCRYGGCCQRGGRTAIRWW
jgi:tripartite-type tricarboxylate transporter receptor subunit TctC